MREMGIDGKLFVSASSPGNALTLGDIAPKCFKAWALGLVLGFQLGGGP
jgi:hypothetical protein